MSARATSPLRSWLFSLSLLPTTLGAQEAIQLLEQPATTRTRALGGATPALIASDIALTFASPALLGQEHHSQLSLSYSPLAGGSHLGSAFYGGAWSERGAWGLGLRYLSYGRLQGYDRWGKPSGSFTASEALLQGSYSYELTDRLRAGISFVGVYSAIESYQRWGLGADLGLNYYDAERELSLGLALVHLGRTFSGEGFTGGSLPWDIQLGWSQRLAHAPFTLHLTLYDLHPKRAGELTTERPALSKAVRHLSFGIEFQPSDRFWIALGYRPKEAQDVHLLRGYRWAGFSGGIGFVAPRFQLSLAYSMSDPGYGTPQLAFSWDLASPR